jgi:hypothetical protein
VNRVGFAVVLAAAIFAAAAFFALNTSHPDDVGDGRRPDTVMSSERPRPAEAVSRNASEPAPPAPRPPSPPTRRKTPPASASSTPAAAALEPKARETATLRVVSDVAGAQVFLNRAFVGTAPATANELAPGSYQLNVSAPGFDNHVETIELTPGDREVTIRFREVHLNASLDVVHKHRFGSCKGTLVATPTGVRYETSDTEDAFESSLLNLETFQVDYLNKNLRIQPRKGKRYDFTDPDGNADRLFVFHREVERARARLKKGDAR